MPKYTVNEVLDIIKYLTTEEKLELQKNLPNVLGAVTALAAPQAVETSSQSMQGMTISGSSNVDIGQAIADRGGSISQPKTSIQAQNTDLQEALSLLEKLKLDIKNSNALNPIEKKTVEVPLQVVEEELKKQKPDKDLVDQAIESLKKGLSGIQELAEPVMKVTELVAKAWEMNL